MLQNRKSPLHNLRFLFFAVFLGTGVFFSGCASTPPPPPMPNFRPASVMTVNLPAPTTGTKRDIYHVVGPYESLWRIAIVYGKDMDSIMRDNQISDATKIKKGQKLLIRNTYGPRPNIPLYPTTRWTHIVIHHTATDVGNAYTIDSAHVNRGWEREWDMIF